LFTARALCLLFASNCLPLHNLALVVQITVLLKPVLGCLLSTIGMIEQTYILLDIVEAIKISKDSLEKLLCARI